MAAQTHRLRMSAFLVCYACFVMVVAVAQTPQPGFRVALTNAGLDYARKEGVPILEKELMGITIPDIHGDAGTPVGHVSYDLTGIQIKSVNIGTSSLSISTTGASLSISSVSVSMSADWHYREDSWPHVSDHGSADISGSSISTSLTIAIDEVKKELNGQLCSIITNEVNVEANKLLSTLPESIKVDNDAMIDFELLIPPTTTSDYIMTSHKGEFFNLVNPIEAPFPVSPLPDPAASLPRMMYLWVTSYLVETAGYVYQRAGRLQYNITAADVPASFPLQLNTKSFALLLPALYKAYPNMPMQLEFQTTGAPIVPIIDPVTGLNVSITFNLTAGVVLNNGSTVVNVFSLFNKAYAIGSVALVARGATQFLTGNLSFLSVDLKTSWSTVGPFPATIFQSVINLFCRDYVIPHLNKAANTGIPLPSMDGISFVNPQIVFGNNNVAIATDISYTPSAQNQD